MIEARSHRFTDVQTCSQTCICYVYFSHAYLCIEQRTAIHMIEARSHRFTDVQTCSQTCICYVYFSHAYLCIDYLNNSRLISKNMSSIKKLQIKMCFVYFLGSNIGHDRPS